MSDRPVLAVDLGGTKTAAAIVSRSGEILARVQEATCQQGPEEGVAQLERMLKELVSSAGLSLKNVDCVGVGIPAVLESETDRVLWAPNISGWKDVDLRGKLQARIDLPVFVEYDGHTAVLGEWWAGAGRGCHSVFCLIVGTGIGGGMILDGRLVRGANRLAGAAGWFAMTSIPEQAGARSHALGHWESLAAGPGMALLAKQGLAARRESILWQAAQQEELTCATIFAAAQAGDEYASELADRLAGWLGLGIANIVSLVNPQRVILGGGVGAHAGFLLARIEEIMRRWAQPVSAQTAQIVVSQLGSDAGLLGAAYGAVLRRMAPGSAGSTENPPAL